MGYLEKKLYEKYEEKYGKNDKENFIKLFKRFLDDCFFTLGEVERRTQTTTRHPEQSTSENTLYDGTQQEQVAILRYSAIQEWKQTIHRHLLQNDGHTPIFEL